MIKHPFPNNIPKKFKPVIAYIDERLKDVLCSVKNESWNTIYEIAGTSQKFKLVVNYQRWNGLVTFRQWSPIGVTEVKHTNCQIECLEDDNYSNIGRLITKYMPQFVEGPREREVRLFLEDKFVWHGQQLHDFGYRNAAELLMMLARCHDKGEIDIDYLFMSDGRLRIDIVDDSKKPFKQAMKSLGGYSSFKALAKILDTLGINYFYAAYKDAWLLQIAFQPAPDLYKW